MPKPKTETRIRQKGQAVIIDLIGDVTTQGQDAVKQAFAQALDHNPTHIFFNLGRTDYINTSGIAVLISLVMEAEKSGRQVGLYGMTPHYRKVFELVRLPLYAEMFESEAEALATL